MTNQPSGVQDKGELDAIPAAQVNKFHNKSDVDSSSSAQHHSLGPRKDQAASGSHTHDGRNSKQLLAGVTLTGSKGGNAALASVVAALAGLGATDSTT